MLFVALAGLWLLLSGYFLPLLLGLGALSVALTIFFSLRMGIIEHNAKLFCMSFGLLSYWIWLMREIVKANLAVTRCIWEPRLNIDPQWIHVKTLQNDEIGKAIYANSITLTPGTVSTDVYSDIIEVHALTRAMAEDLQRGEIDRHIPRNPARESA